MRGCEYKCNIAPKRRLLVSAEVGHSAYWRRDKSSVELLELAKLLGGIRKAVSHIGRNIGSVVWEGMPYKTEDIALDPSPVLGAYPIPADKADIVVGIAVHEAFHKTEWTDHVIHMARTNYALSPVYKYKFSRFIEMAEKVYVDLISNRSIYGAYTERARKWAQRKAKNEFISPPTFIELMHIWWDMATDREKVAYKKEYDDPTVVGMVGRISSTQFYREPLAILNGIVEGFEKGCSSRSSVKDRCDFRLELYAAIFDKLLEKVKFWPADRRDPFLVSGAIRENDEREGRAQEAVRSILLSYADEIERNLQKKRVDFTEQVKGVVANFGDMARVEGNDFVMPARNTVDNALLYQLKTFFRSLAQRNFNYNRGLKSGKIDRSRLFRVATNGSIFTMKKFFFELKNDIILLVDCTGSMAEPDKWAKIETIYQTLFLAILSYNSNARIFAYNERKDTCRITEIYMQGKFFSVTPHGRTASGEAIIATTLFLRDSKRRPIIIHLTDGASNWGCGVSDAIRHCEESKIRLLTLGLKCDPMNKDMLRKEYGKYVQFVENLNQLPLVFKKLFN
ncbi:vWA domain-containing protein [Desulfuromonas sp. TF]|uniref:vWA domain-containing protein n=1 Tax=Desulfuromonas sp. TF TaxID=1232410 RepID=UPI000418C515|nr:vWA domain-containing protein [Desulfuromonas sp. TF]